MKSIINELWYGNIDPLEGGLFNKPIFKEHLHNIGQSREALEKTLNEEQTKALEKLMEQHNQLDSVTEEAIFACGFRLGAKIMLEMLMDTEKLSL